MSNEEYVLRKEFNSAKDSIDKRLSEHDRKIATLEVLCTNLKGLPDEVSKVKMDTALMNQMLGTQSNLIVNLTKEFQDYIAEQKRHETAQNKRINDIDDKSKIDIIDWIKAHWLEIITTGAVLAVFAKEFIK